MCYVKFVVVLMSDVIVSVGEYLMLMMCMLLYVI